MRCNALRMARLNANHITGIGLKAVGESVVKPIEYYQNNVQGTLTLVDAMRDAGVFKLVFSSSATVYGDPASLPIREDFPVGGTTNPYGTSKLMVEMMLQDIAKSDKRFAFAILRQESRQTDGPGQRATSCLS